MPPPETIRDPKSVSAFWSGDEHNRFLDAVKIYGKDWDSITKHVGTKNNSQVIYHVQ